MNLIRRMLFTKRADRRLKTPDGKPAADIAREPNRAQVASLLVQAAVGQ